LKYARSMEQLWLENKKEISYTIYGLLAPGGLLVLTGEPGVGKSWLAQQIGFELACGHRILGLFSAVTCKVIYFEMEQMSELAEERFQEDVWKVKYGEKGKRNMGLYNESRIKFDNHKSIDEFKRIVTEFGGARVVIMDSYSVTLDDEIKLKQQKNAITNYREVAKEMGMGVILIQHLVKRGQAYNNKNSTFIQAPLKLDDIRGSKFLQYEVDTAIGLTHQRKGIRELGFLKNRFAKVDLSAEPPLELRWNPDSASPLWPTEFRLPVIMEILDQRTSISFTELETILPNKENQETTGITRPTLRKDIERLKDLGLVYLDEGGGKGNESVVHRI